MDPTGPRGREVSMHPPFVKAGTPGDDATKKKKEWCAHGVVGKVR